MKEGMTMRERMVPLMQGKEHDRVPFACYDYSGFPPKDDVWALIGCEDMGLLRWVAYIDSRRRTATPNRKTLRVATEKGCDGRFIRQRGSFTRSASSSPCTMRHPRPSIAARAPT